MTNGLPFAFEGIVGQTWTIREHSGARRSWTLPDQAVSSAPPDSDYALISRIFDKQTGKPFVAFGGIAGAGTEAAGECVMSAECIAAAARIIPRGWERRNLQIVIRTRVISGIPGAPEVISARSW